MFEYLNDQLLDALFADAPPDPMAWHGVSISIDDGLEVVPLHFYTTRHLVFFSTIAQQFGGDLEIARDMVEAWGGGFKLKDEHRLIKLIRADATDPVSIYDSDHWKLGTPGQIFQFGEVMLSAILTHAEELPEVQQYVFKPADARLEKFYKRILRRHNSSCLAAGFTPILEIDVEEGGFYGYQRSTS